jgi:acyl-coenzyme A thioesterase PaaI-like protein
VLVSATAAFFIVTLAGAVYYYNRDKFVKEPDAFMKEIEAELQAHPLVTSLNADSRFTSSRPHMKIPPPLRHLSFTGGTLMGSDKVAVPPLVFTTVDGSDLVSVVYLGEALCGHPGIVHGGMLATLLDEGLARCCFAALPNKVGMTAKLEINYRAPCKAEQFVVLKASTVKVEGRKAWVTGRLETLPKDGSPGRVLAEGNALFVEPKNAAVMGRLMKITNA